MWLEHSWRLYQKFEDLSCLLLSYKYQNSYTLPLKNTLRYENTQNEQSYSSSACSTHYVGIAY